MKFVSVHPDTETDNYTEHEMEIRQQQNVSWTIVKERWRSAWKLCVWTYSMSLNKCGGILSVVGRYVGVSLALKSSTCVEREELEREIWPTVVLEVAMPRSYKTPKKIQFQKGGFVQGFR